MKTTLDDIRAATGADRIDSDYLHAIFGDAGLTAHPPAQRVLHYGDDLMPLPERREQSLLNLTQFYNSIEPFVFVYGGIGDALLALSKPLDTMHSVTVVACMNSAQSMAALVAVFPQIRTVHSFPMIADYTTMLYFRHHTIHHPKCIAHGAISDHLEQTLWNENLDLKNLDGVTMYPDWVRDFPIEQSLRAAAPYCVIAPKGSMHGMFRSKRNIIRPQYWKPLLAELVRRGLTPVVLGLPDDEAWYPLTEQCIDKRSYNLEEQMRIIRGARLMVAADSWHKTFAAMAQIPAVVFQPVTGIDLHGVKDNSHYVFLDLWKEIRVASTFADAISAVDAIVPAPLSSNVSGNVSGNAPVHTIREPRRRTNVHEPLSMHDSIFTQDYAGATNVLIRSSSALGDSLMLTAVTEELRTQFPHLHISVSGNDLVREVFRFNTSVDSVLTANSPAEFAVEERADIVIEYNHIIDRIQEYYNGAHFMDILGAIAGIRLHSKSLHYTLSATDTHNAATLIHEQYPVRPPMLIGIHCHTEKDLKRSYPYTVALVTALQALYPNAGIIHFGNYTYSDMPKGVLDCADRRTSLRTQIATAKECTAFISIDSAFFHIAHNLFGKPTLLLQSVTNEQLIGNLENTIVRVMRSGRTNCTPCYWSCKQHCLSQIHPVEIAAEFNTFLAELHDTGTTPETPLHSQVLV